MANLDNHETFDNLTASTAEPEVKSNPEAEKEPLPAIGAIYKELFEMEAVEEVSLSTACCYSD